MTAAHGLSVLVYKTACVVRYSFTQISPQLPGLLPSSRVKSALSSHPNTSGAVLLIVEIHMCTFLPLLIPL